MAVTEAIPDGLECGEILLLDGATLTYAEFEARCLVPNRAALVRFSVVPDASSGASSSSGAGFDVTALRAALAPARLLAEFGPDEPVPVRRCCFAATPVAADSTQVNSEPTLPSECAALQNQGELIADDCADATLGSFVDAVAAASSQGEAPAARSSSLYLKDWHWQQRRADLGLPPLYTVPAFLGPDWLNAYCHHRRREAAATPAERNSSETESGSDGPPRSEASALRFGNGDDYRFAYLGERGTFTPLHRDVFGSYSWSLNVQGAKEWIFARHGDVADAVVEAAVDAERRRGALLDARVSAAIVGSGAVVRLVQREGELVFVPSMRWHQVHNLSSWTVSINHNWCNQFAAPRMAALLAREAREAADLVDPSAREAFGGDGSEEWQGMVDRMLLSGVGWNRPVWRALLRFAKERPEMLPGDASVE